MIQCEITKVFNPQAFGQGFSFKTDDDMKDFKEKFFNEQFGSYSTSVYTGGSPCPEWIVVGTKFNADFKINKGYLTLKGQPQIIYDASKNDDSAFESDNINLEDISDDLDDSFDPSQFEKETETKPSDPTINKINNMAELYAKIFKAIHTHEYLSKLDTGLKKDIATSFFIEYNKR